MEIKHMADKQSTNKQKGRGTQPAQSSLSRYRTPLIAAGAAILLVVLMVALLASGEEPAEVSAPSAQPAAGGSAVIGVESTLLDTGSEAPPQVGEVAPNFSYTLADGTTHQLADLRGKKVLINFWATWCPPCREEMPDIQQVSNDYGGNFVVLAISRDDGPEQIRDFAQEMGLTFPLIANTTGDVSTRYGARGLPMSYFVNTDGTISYRQIGFMTRDFIETRVEEMQ
jgi:peroxiredoxin